MNAYLFWIRHVPEQSEKGVWRPACASRTREVCWGCVASAAFWVSLKDLSYFQSGFVWGFFFIKYI